MIQRRNTSQRRVILEEVRGVSSHPTVEEIYAMAKKRLPRISLGTVYRNLEGLTNDGMVIKLQTAGTRKRFDGNPARHYHIRCVTCGRVDDLPVRVAPDIEPAIKERTGYRILGCRMEFDGVCPRCRKKRS